MKTKSLIFGMVIAISAALSSSTAHAQDQPAIKVVPAMEQDYVKIIYGYNTVKSVTVKFLTNDGILKTDNIKGKNFEGGFIKKYNLESLKGSTFWVEIVSPEHAVTFKMIPYKQGKWTAQLEKSTHNYGALAKR
jgi:hypothetical protein